MSASSKQKPAAPVTRRESWDIKNWPAHVWPGDPKRADWVIRSNKTELTKAGVLTRLGRVLIVDSEKYHSWLFATEKRRAVDNFETNLNREAQS